LIWLGARITLTICTLTLTMRPTAPTLLKPWARSSFRSWSFQSADW
jgi:hypothetical protein